MSAPRRTAWLLAVVLTCALPTGGAQAAPTTENIATATIEQDQGRAFDFAWQLTSRKTDDPVQHLNSARARSVCVGCRATAIAFQIVLVAGNPRAAVPVNTAEAYNVGCTECVTVAEARQFVRVLPEPVKFTDAGRAILADVRAQLRALETADLPFEQVHQAVEAQETRVLEALRTELVLRSDPDTEADAVLQQRLLQDADLG